MCSVNELSFLVKQILEKGFENYKMFDKINFKEENKNDLTLHLCESIFNTYKSNYKITNDEITISNLDYLRRFFEIKEDYEKCDDLLKIKNKLNEKN